MKINGKEVDPDDIKSPDEQVIDELNESNQELLACIQELQETLEDVKGAMEIYQRAPGSTKEDWDFNSEIGYINNAIQKSDYSHEVNKIQGRALGKFIRKMDYLMDNVYWSHRDDAVKFMKSLVNGNDDALEYR